jgi:hypothetical protein
MRSTQLNVRFGLKAAFGLFRFARYCPQRGRVPKLTSSFVL